MILRNVPRQDKKSNVNLKIIQKNKREDVQFITFDQ